MRTVRCSGRRGGGHVSQHALGRGMSARGVSATPPVDRMTDACENIT